MIEFTRLLKDGGPLTKHISLKPDGSIKSEGANCRMSAGWAWRQKVSDLSEFAKIISELNQSEGITLGSLRADLHDGVEITTKNRLRNLGDSAGSDLIARTSRYMGYPSGQPVIVLLDIDTKGMPPSVRKVVMAYGGYWPTLLTVLPGLAGTARVVRNSTSSGLYRTDTGAPIPGSDGSHIFVLVTDGSDVERFLRTFHDRCWLHGLGWKMVGEAGQLLDRSLIDKMVYTPERLVFEGAPVLEHPIAQRADAREAEAISGDPFDSRNSCPSLSPVEQAKAKQARRLEDDRLKTEATEARAKFVARHAKRISERTGCSVAAATHMVHRWCGGVLLPAVELPFDDGSFHGKTVADVLADPDSFVGATLADPLEGPDYGVCKAMVMRRDDGTLWIHSFAHGRTFYDLKRDAAAVEALFDAAAAGDDASPYVKMMVAADLDENQEGRLKDLLVEKTGTKLRPLNALLKSAKAEQSGARTKARDERKAAADNDKRLHLPAPQADGERSPVMRCIDEVLGNTGEVEPPMRNTSGYPVEVRVRAPSALHELTSECLEQEATGKTRLPAPSMPMLCAHDKYSMAHTIERYITFETSTEKGGTFPVALPPVFVDHYINFRESVLPIVDAVVTAPLVLTNGSLLAHNGLDRDRKLVFRIEPDLAKLLPARIPSATQAAEALYFLTNTWLCDVSASFAGKCVLIALAMSILERPLLPERPAFFATAGKRGGGKTTALSMISLAVLGKKPAAAAWSSNEEERRKSMLAYLADGAPLVVWDNLSLGSLISCKVLEAVLTSSSYEDRVLGESRKINVPAYTIMCFTGNNIAPKGDMASRSLVCRLDVDRPDPENREFIHSDPMGWTLDHRGVILSSLYTVMMANPTLRSGEADVKTRFKTWMRLIGTAIENAAETLVANSTDGATSVNFQSLFASVEADDEDSNGLFEVLELMSKLCSNDGKSCFSASDVAKFVNGYGEGMDYDDRDNLRALFIPSAKPGLSVSAKTIGKRLSAMCDAPVQDGDRVLTLRKMERTNNSKEAARYRIQVTEKDATLG